MSRIWLWQPVVHIAAGQLRGRLSYACRRPKLFYQFEGEGAVATHSRVRYLFQMPDRCWTHTVPPDLRPRLEAALSARHHGPAEVWAAFMEWMVEHDMPVPDSVNLTSRPEDDVVIHRN